MEVAKTLNVTQARGKLGDLINDVNFDNKMVKLTRNSDYVGIVPKFICDYLTAEFNYKNLVALFITEHLLKDASSHMKASQRKEIQELDDSQISHLIHIHKFPLPAEKREEILKNVGATFIERLEKRYAIAKEISEAKAEGLLDVLEDATGNVDFK